MGKRVAIIGAGPAGLAVGLRLRELGVENWCIFEKEERVGGLCASFKDDAGFTWDQGGHVLFSKDDAIDSLFENIMDGNYLRHEREAWIKLGTKWIPYPFQNNIRYLAAPEILRCLRGLLKARGKNKAGLKGPTNFDEWISDTFGEGIAALFMHPYNNKVWAWPLEQLSFQWIGERVSVPSPRRILTSIVLGKDDAGWGPNNVFKFPLSGGTGDIFERMAETFREKIRVQEGIVHIDIERKEFETAKGACEDYDILVSSAPLSDLMRMISGNSSGVPKEAASGLKHNRVTVVGVGLEKSTDSSKCWMYFPDPSLPFYRITNFSHYSHNNVPGGFVNKYSSLMCEIAHSDVRPNQEEEIVQKTLGGLRNLGFLAHDEKPISLFVKTLEKAYPIPTRDRDNRLAEIQPYLMEHNIHSIGRFGTWRYEIGNMDHAVKMGTNLAETLAQRLYA